MTRESGYLTAADGVRLFYQVTGSGPRIVIIPDAIHLFDDFKRLSNGRTLVFYDLRNRGRSDSISERSQLERGIHHDVDDLEAVRKHFGIARFDVIGFSYLGMMVILYAMRHPDHIGRIVQLGPIQPDPQKSYPAHLSNNDDVLEETLNEMQAIGAEMRRLTESGRADAARDLYRTLGRRIRRMLVADPAKAHRLDHWDFADLQTEVDGMKHWQKNIEPSIRRITLAPEDLANVQAPVLTVHGTKDRNAPYGGSRDWVALLPNARLVTIERAAHASWVDAPGPVMESIETFLSGAWPASAERISAPDPAA